MQAGVGLVGSRAVLGLHIYNYIPLSFLCTTGCLKPGTVVWKYILFSRCIAITAASGPVQDVGGKR